MPPVQTSYSATFPIGKEGAIADNEGTVILSKSAATAIKPGRFVARGTADGYCKLPASTNDVIDQPPLILLGVSALIPGREPAWQLGLTAGEYPTNDTVPIVRKGRVWMLTEEAVNFGDPVYVRFTANGSASPGEVGCVRKSADTGKASIAPHCRFVMTVAGAGLVLVEINLPA